MRHWPKRIPGRGIKRRDGYASRLEAKFALELTAWYNSGRIIWHAYEPWTFRLAKRTSYTPDFATQLPDGEIVIYECKGFMREDAHIKLKMAAEKFPFRFIIVREVRRAFEFTDVDSWAGEDSAAAPEPQGSIPAEAGGGENTTKHKPRPGRRGAHRPRT